MQAEKKLLDIFCGAGGCSEGYHRAGFKPYGIDNNPKPLRHYPFPYACMDALEAMDRLLAGEGITFSNGETLYLDNFVAFHASPPCQFGSTMTKGRWKGRYHINLIPDTRQRLLSTGKPFVIENVEGARKELINPVKLCGSMFGLQTRGGSQLRRHRYFECNEFYALSMNCQHIRGSSIGVYGGGQHPQRRVPATIGVWGNAGGSSNRDGLIQFGTQDRRDAMGIDWMAGKELSEAIPPAYTEYIGKYLMQAVDK